MKRILLSAGSLSFVDFIVIYLQTWKILFAPFILFITSVMALCSDGFLNIFGVAYRESWMMHTFSTFLGFHILVGWAHKLPNGRKLSSWRRIYSNIGSSVLTNLSHFTFLFFSTFHPHILVFLLLQVWFGWLEYLFPGLFPMIEFLSICILGLLNLTDSPYGLRFFASFGFFYGLRKYIHLRDWKGVDYWGKLDFIVFGLIGFRFEFKLSCKIGNALNEGTFKANLTAHQF